MTYKMTLATLLFSISACTCGGLSAATPASSEEHKETSEPATKPEEFDVKQISEAFGHFIGRNLKSPGLEFDLESIISGIRSGAKGEPAPMTDQEYEIAMSKLQERAFNALSQDNLSAANDFMAANQGKEGVSVIEEGKLQYETLQEGNGPEVVPGSAPLIHYTGKYIDGTVFGCSEEVGGPITIPLDQTIPGFSKGLVGMKEGEKRRLYVHPDLGYGTLGNLPPNALLVFDIEVVKADSNREIPDEESDGDDDEDDDEDYPSFDDEEDVSEPIPFNDEENKS